MDESAPRAFSSRSHLRHLQLRADDVRRHCAYQHGHVRAADLFPGRRPGSAAGCDRAVSDLQPRPHRAVPDPVRVGRPGQGPVGPGVVLAGVRGDAPRGQRDRAADLLLARLGRDRPGVLPHAGATADRDPDREAGVADHRHHDPHRNPRAGARASHPGRAGQAHRGRGVPDDQRADPARRRAPAPARRRAGAGRAVRARTDPGGDRPELQGGRRDRVRAVDGADRRGSAATECA